MKTIELLKLNEKNSPPSHLYFRPQGKGKIEGALHLFSSAKVKKLSLRFLIFFLFLPVLKAAPFRAEKKSLTMEEKLKIFFQKDNVIVGVTDSGLGGLSVMAEATERMKEAGIFRKVNFVYFNALFSEAGYNSLKSHAEKVQIFNSALYSLEKNFHPDLILIACNTLSVIYGETLFSKKSSIPVAGIVDTGVELIGESLKKNPDSLVIIFATKTTVEEGTYKKMLIEKGFEPERIITEPCTELVNYIEKDYQSDETDMLIFFCVDEALKKVPDPKPPLYASLNCTHFGYSLELWKKAFEKQGIKPLAILNPNSRMIDFLFEPQRLGRFKETEIRARVVSMVEISQEKIKSLGEWLRNLSPQAASALESYELKPNIFEWKKFIQGKAPY